MNKILAYIIIAIGLLGVVVYTVPEVAEVTDLPKDLSGTPLIVVSIVILAIGIFFVVRGGSRGGKQAEEVPIYKGKNVVGYRRH